MRRGDDTYATLGTWYTLGVGDMEPEPDVLATALKAYENCARDGTGKMMRITDWAAVVSWPV